MLFPALIAKVLGSVTYLECQVADPGTPLAVDAPYVLAVALSFGPALDHVETRGPGFRTSTRGVSSGAGEWRWDDWRDGILGTSRINKTTLAYRVDRGDRHAVGRCRERGTPLWLEFPTGRPATHR